MFSSSYIEISKYLLRYFCIPWHEVHFLGPTETPITSDLDSVSADAVDIDFLFTEVNRLLPGLAASRKDILSSWAGIRPPTFDSALPDGNRSSEIHDLQLEGLENVFAMTGGPIMTYRSAVIYLLKVNSKTGLPSGKTNDINWATLDLKSGTSPTPIVESKPTIHLGHIKRAIVQKHAQTLSDLLYCHLGLSWRHYFTQSKLEEIRLTVASELVWNEQRRQEEIAAYMEEAKILFGVPRSQ